MELYEVFMCGCRRYKVPGGIVLEPCALHSQAEEGENDERQGP
jgi:hypothetical protein